MPSPQTAANGSQGLSPSDSLLSAEPPRAPEPSPALRQAQAERDTYVQGRERVERRSVLRGLLLLALVVLLFSLIHAGAGRAFYPGWWRQW